MNTPVKKERRALSAKAVIVLCMLIVVMEGYNLITYGIVIPLLLQDPTLGMGEQTAGLIGGIVYAGGLIGILISSPIAEKWGRHRVMTAAAGVFAIGSVLAAISTSPEFLGTARFITGLGVGAAFTSAMTLARNHASMNRASLVITATTAGVPLGGTLASLYGIFLMPIWGWRSNFWFGAILTVIILVVSASCYITEPKEVKAVGGSMRLRLAPLFQGRAWILTVFVGLASVTNLVTWLGLNAWLAESMSSSGFTLTQALALTFVLTGAAVIGSFFTATAGDRFGPAKIGVLCSVFTLAGLLGVLFGPTTLLLAILFVALMGIGGHSTQNLITAAATNHVAPYSRGTIIAITNIMAYVGSFLGPTVGGNAFAQGGPSGLFAAYSVSAALCVVMCVGLYAARRSTENTAHIVENVEAR